MLIYFCTSPHISQRHLSKLLSVSRVAWAHYNLLLLFFNILMPAKTNRYVGRLKLNHNGPIATDEFTDLRKIGNWTSSTITQGTSQQPQIIFRAYDKFSMIDIRLMNFTSLPSITPRYISRARDGKFASTRGFSWAAGSFWLSQNTAVFCVGFCAFRRGDRSYIASRAWSELANQRSGWQLTLNNGTYCLV